MKNFGLPKTKRLTGYTWIQAGLTSMTGNPLVQNRVYDGEALDVIVHFGDHHSVWIQEMYNKVGRTCTTDCEKLVRAMAGPARRRIGRRISGIGIF
jgi:hypothetical protein